MSSSFYRTALVLGLLTAIGPFAIDMYLPALPAIGLDLGADTAAVQLSLISFVITFSLAQLVYGPLSDMYGRKAPIYVGCGLFTLAGIGCALAPDIDTLVVFRFIQGLGACAGMVIARAVVRDLHTGTDAARLMSLLILVFGASPILAPLAGSLTIEFAGWRGIFWAVTAAGIVGLALTAFALKETRPPAQRLESSIGSALAAYRVLLGDWNFLGLSLIGGFGIASFFAFLANSSFVLIEHYGLSPMQYSIAFSVNAVAFIGVAQIAGWVIGRWGIRPVVRMAVVGFAAAMMLLLGLALAGITELLVMSTLLFIGYGFLGLVVPTTAVLALEEHGAIAGTASALMGTLHLVTGVAVVGVMTVFFDGTALFMIGGIAGSAIATLVLTQATLGRRRPVAVPAE